MGGLRYWTALWFNTLLHEWVVTKRGLPFITLLYFDLITTLSYTGACALVLLKLRINPRLRQLRDVVWFILVVALAASLVVALLQTINLAAAGIVPWSGWLVNTLRYWAGDATGIGMLAPFLLILLRQVPCVWAHRESETERMNGTDNELSLPSR